MPRLSSPKKVIKQEPVIGVRLSAECREYIKSKAKEGFRSMSREIEMRVERTRQQEAAGAAQ